MTSDRNQQYRDIAGEKNPNNLLEFFGVLGFFLIWVRIFYLAFKCNSHGKTYNRTGNFTS